MHCSIYPFFVDEGHPSAIIEIPVVTHQRQEASWFRFSDHLDLVAFEVLAVVDYQLTLKIKPIFMYMRFIRYMIYDI